MKAGESREGVGGEGCLPWQATAFWGEKGRQGRLENAIESFGMGVVSRRPALERALRYGNCTITNPLPLLRSHSPSPFN